MKYAIQVSINRLTKGCDEWFSGYKYYCGNYALMNNHLKLSDTVKKTFDSIEDARARVKTLKNVKMTEDSITVFSFDIVGV